MSKRKGGAIESRSIDWIPDAERHGKVWQQGPLWFLGNLEFFTIAVGFIGPSRPVMGLPQMIQTRAQMGYRGVSIALLAAFATYAGTCIAAIVLLSQGLKGTFGWDPTLIAVISAVFAAVAAIFGHDLLHRAFQVLLFISLPFYLILTVAILVGGISGGHPAPHGGFALAAFVAQFAAASAWNITYAPFVSDYSRYMPKDTSAKAIIANVFLGAGGSAVWLVAVGAWLASEFGATDALVGLQQAGNSVFDGMGDILAVLSALALIGVMGLNTYSGHLTLLTAVDSVRSIKPSKLLRIVVTAAFAVAWLLAGLAVKPDAVTTVFTTLTLMLYLLVPWTSLNLVDYFFVRKGHYKISDLFTPNGMYGAWNWRGITAYAVGLAAEVPFMVLPDIYTGPVAKSMDGVDIAFFVGLVVAGLVYFLLHRGANYDIGRTIPPTESDPADPPVVAAGVGGAVMRPFDIDIADSAARIAADVERLSHPPFTDTDGVIRRWAFTPSYAATDEWVRGRLERLGFVVEHDAAGSLVGRNTEAGASAFGLGSHIDSNRNGGPWDGTLGVVCALEIARLDAELGLGLPLRVFAFSEEEGSGFGEVLLGSRVMTGACTEPDLRERIRDEHGTSFQEAAAAAGFGPLDLDASRRHLDGLRAWVEIHIEQARQLEAADVPLGNVTVIAGCIQGDLVFSGRADHAGATPMELRRDAFAAAAAVAVALERSAAGAGDGTVATIGQVRIEPGQRTTVPARAILEVDARSTGSGHVELMERVVERAHQEAAGRGLTASWEPRQQRPPTPLDERVRTALRDAAVGRWDMLDLASGAVHDTMLVAGLVPAGMVFIPCEDGRSHTPLERADPTHAAQAVDVVLRALVTLSNDAT